MYVLYIDISAGHRVMLLIMYRLNYASVIET